MGDGDEEPRLREQAARLGLAGRVVFAGHRDDVPAVLGAIDLLAISSLYEGTPLALFEAMAAGKAIVSTAVDGCREVLEDERSALLVPPGDAPALATALERALGDQDCARASRPPPARTSKRYDIRACVGNMEALYDEVLAELERRLTWTGWHGCASTPWRRSRCRATCSCAATRPS